MRVVGPFFAILASIVTIFAAIVRLWWAKPKFRGKQEITDVRGTMDDPMIYPVKSTKGPTWLHQVTKWWLVFVLFGGTAIILIVVIFTLIDMST